MPTTPSLRSSVGKYCRPIILVPTKDLLLPAKVIELTAYLSLSFTCAALYEVDVQELIGQVMEDKEGVILYIYANPGTKEGEWKPCTPVGKS